ncbi:MULTISPECIES: hypothetical protein [Pseudomonas]|uniref:hypothetical protein n=1 Tax=Pseudomonas sp. BF-R-19 TaxID=2832397 RepID=UPI001CC1B5C8|nr:hypothetical protein [Pseudomonas sp. BF-R-19]
MMNLWTAFQLLRTRAILIGCWLSVSAMKAGAIVLPITATFNPEPGNPLKNEFKNTTPNQGFCRDYPEICRAHNIFSLRSHVGGVPLNGPIEANHADIRAGAMIKTPAAWRNLSVRHRETGEEVMLEVRIAGMGGVYDLSHSVMELTGTTDLRVGHRVLWGSSWATAPSPCVSIGRNSYYGYTGFAFFWLTPEEQVCSKQAKFPIPGLGYRYLDFTYQLRTPDPLKMSTGIYEGTQVYTIMPGGDFDLGDIVAPTDSIIQLDFTLTVEHALKVDVPPGGNQIELVPQGGWQGWLNQGRKPVRLFRDQTFTISTSSRFKMRLECQYIVGNTCALREAKSADLVPLQMGVSLPNGLTDASGQSVNRLPLRLDGSGSELFQPGFYLDRKPGTLHFEIAREHVESMLSEGVRKTYSGDVTVIWDSEV